MTLNKPATITNIIGVCNKCGKQFDDYNGRKHRKYVCRACFNVYNKMARRKACETLEGQFKQLLNPIKYYKYRKVLDCELDVEYLLKLYDIQDGRCAVSNIKMTWGQEDPKGRNKKYRKPLNVSIERVDNSKGYTKDNVLLVCYAVNAFKNMYSISTVYEVADEIVKHKSRLDKITKLRDEYLEANKL